MILFWVNIQHYKIYFHFSLVSLYYTCTGSLFKEMFIFYYPLFSTTISGDLMFVFSLELHLEKFLIFKLWHKVGHILLIKLIYLELQVILGRICPQVLSECLEFQRNMFPALVMVNDITRHISQIQRFVVLFFWPEETLLPGKCSHRMLCWSFINVLADWKQNVFPPCFCSFPLGKPGDWPHEPMCVAFAYFFCAPAALVMSSGMCAIPGNT